MHRVLEYINISDRIQRVFFSLSLAMGVVACTSENDGGQFSEPDAEAIAPTIESIKPEIENGVLVETDSIITIEFSELLDIDSVLNDGIRLGLRDVSRAASSFGNEERPIIDNDNASIAIDEIVVPGTDPVTGEDIEQLATRVSLTPEENELALGSIYEFAVEPTVKDRSSIESLDPVTGEDTEGNFFRETELRIIGTEEGTWQDELREQIPGTLDIRDLRFASNENSKAHAIWHEFDAPTNVATLKSLAFDILDTTFTSLGAAPLTSDPTTIPANANASGTILDTEGTALGTNTFSASWIQQSADTGTRSLFLNYFNGTDWLAEAVRLSSTNTVIDHLVLPIPDNRLLIVWIEDNAGTFELRVNELEPSVDFPNLVPTFDTNTWLTSASLVTSSATETFANLQGAASVNQRAAIAWEQSIGGIRSVHSVIFNYSSGLQLSNAFESDNAFDGFNPSVAISDSGEGYLVWQQFDGIRHNIWRTQFVGNFFGTAELVERNNLIDANNPVVAVCRNGITTVLWNQTSGVQNEIYTSRTLFDDSGWSDPELVGRANEIINSVSIKARYDRSCNLIAIWSDSNAGRSLDSAQFGVIEKTWSASVTIGEFGNTSTDFNSVNLVPLRTGGRFMALYRRVFEGRFIPHYSLFNDSSD